jgi:hypothetical protein
MPRAQLPFTNGYYQTASLPYSAQRCVNLYPVVAQAGALSPEALYSTPGVVQFGILPEGRARGAIFDGDRLLAVVGNRLYELRPSGLEITVTGPNVTGSGPVSMATNGIYTVILSPGAECYVYSPPNVSSVPNGILALVTDSDFRANGNPTSVTYIDGYFVYTTDTGKVIVSELNDPFNYNALDFGAADASPDRTVTCFTFRNQLMIAGTESVEVFNNVGGTNFPFQRTGLFFDQGVRAQFSVVKTAAAVYFVGAGQNESVSVWALSGNGTERISTDAIDYLLGQFSEQQIARTTAWHYSQDGHFFVGFNLPNTTIVFDATTGRWHERRSTLSGPDPYTTRWRIEFIVAAYGRLIALDIIGNGLGELKTTVATEFDQTVIREFITLPFQNNMMPFTVPWMELTVESGLGSVADDPEISLDISRDGGKTWDNKRRRGLGLIGQYGRRAVWRRNGRPNRFDVYRFSYSDPFKLSVLQLTADIA